MIKDVATDSIAERDQEYPLDTEIVSDFILYEREQIKKATSGVDLIKLVYLSHSWSLGIHGNPLITEEIEAWAFGPMIPSIYNRFLSFINRPIRIESRYVVGELTNKQLSLMSSVLETYEDFDSWSLSAIANKPGSPWDQIMRIYGVGATIPNELLQEHYGKIYKEHHAEK